MKKPSPEQVAQMVKERRDKQGPGALIKNPVVNGIGGSWVKK